MDNPINQNGDDKPARPRVPSPRFLPTTSGKTVSIAGVVERVVGRFEDEYDRDSPILKEADTEGKRIKLVHDVAEYIFAVESIAFSPHDQSLVIQRAYDELFGYGALDHLFRDPEIVTIFMEGAHQISVRTAPGAELQPLEPIFEDMYQLHRMIGRLLRDADAEWHEDLPILEVGLPNTERRISLSLVAPPFSPYLTVDIRLHPVELPTLDDLVDSGFMNQSAQVFLEAIVKSEHGFMIIGDTESGKTTLLSILANMLPNLSQVVAVERTGELALTEDVEQYVVKWGLTETDEVTFGDSIQLAVESEPELIILDEVRADDEPQAIAPLLSGEHSMRQIWAFRGASEAKRLKSALGMVARMSDPTQPEEMIEQLYRRLPFVIMVKRRRTHLQLMGIAEWQFDETAGYPQLVELMELGWDGLEVTDKKPNLSLDLPDDFWS